MAILAVRPLGVRPDPHDGRHLWVWLVAGAPADAAPLRGRSPGLVPGRARGPGHRHRLAAGCVRGPVADGAHAAAPAVAAHRAATAPLRRTLPPTAARAAAACCQARAGAIPRLAGAVGLWPPAHASAVVLARLCRDRRSVACARVV